MSHPGVRYVNPYSPKDQENLHELHQLFPTADKNFVAQTYEAKQRNFEHAFKAIDQSLKYNQELNALARVPPEIKLSFLRLAFDKLNPDWIQQVLQRYNWSAEASLDDILRAEEARVRTLEEQRRREEEERRKREEAERALIEAKRVENEKQNVVIFCQSMFPYLPAHFVADIVARHGFNADAAAATLAQHEAQRLAHEQALQRQREEQALREQEARRAAELREVEAQMAQNQAKIQEKLPNLLQCQDWDQVAQLVLQSPATTSSAPADDRTEALVRAVAKANPKVDPKVVAKILKDQNFDVDASLVLVRAQEFNDAFQQMLTVFPDLSQEQVRDVLNVAFPDTGKAMQDLQPIATDFAEEKLLRESIQNETRFLAESKKKLAEWEHERAQIMARRAERKRHVDEAKTPEERGFMQMVDEMQTQKEDIEIKQNDEKLRLDVATRESKISQLQDKLEELLERREARKAAAGRPESSSADIQRRKAEYLKYMSEETKNLENQQSDAAQKRQSIVARRLREQIGDDRFNQLQKAIGRAPGGFSVSGVESPRASDALPGIIAAQVRERSRASIAIPATASPSTSSNQPSPLSPAPVPAPSVVQPAPQAPSSNSNPFLSSNPFIPTNPFVPERPVFAQDSQHQRIPQPHLSQQNPAISQHLPQSQSQINQSNVQHVTQSVASMSLNPQQLPPTSGYGAMPPRPAQVSVPQHQALHAPHPPQNAIGHLVGSYQPQPHPQQPQQQPPYSMQPPPTQMHHSAAPSIQQQQVYYGQHPYQASGVYQTPQQQYYAQQQYLPTQPGAQQQPVYYYSGYPAQIHQMQQGPQPQQHQQPGQGPQPYGYPGQYSQK